MPQSSLGDRHFPGATPFVPNKGVFVRFGRAGDILKQVGGTATVFPSGHVLTVEPT
jgi:hypothetical protein